MYAATLLAVTMPLAGAAHPSMAVAATAAATIRTIFDLMHHLVLGDKAVPYRALWRTAL